MFIAENIWEKADLHNSIVLLARADTLRTNNKRLSWEMP